MAFADRFSGVLASTAIKAPCDAVSIVNLTLSAAQTVNGVAVVTGDRVLVAAQSDPIENGIYDVDSATAWSRASDWDGNRDVVDGTLATIRRANGRHRFYQADSAVTAVVVGTTAVTFTPSDGPNVSYGLTVAESSAGLVVADIDDSVDPVSGLITRYHAVVDGATDDSAAWTNAVAVGGIIRIPPGTTILASATFTTLDLLANTCVIGAGKGLSIIDLTGATEKRIFLVENISNVHFKDFSISGNSVASAYVSANAIYVHQTGSTVMKNFTVTDVGVTNFKSDAWICFHNDGGTAAIQDIHVTRVTGISLTGNFRGSAISFPTAMIWFEGEETNTTGKVKDAWVNDCWMDCEFTKTGIWIWDNCSNITVNDPYIKNAGLDSGFSDDTACYAIGIYDNSLGAGADSGKNIKINNPVIRDPRDAGIYVTQANDVQINNPDISGQSSDVDTTLPKAAIAFNTGYGRINGGILRDNQIGLWINADTGQSVTVDGTKILECKAGGEGIKQKIGGGSVNRGKLILNNVDSIHTNATTTALFLQTTNTGFTLEGLYINGGRYEGTTHAMNFAKTAGNLEIDMLALRDVEITGAVSMTNNLNPTFLDNVTLISNADENSLDARTTTKLHINGLKCRDKTTGSIDMLNLTGAEGTLRGVTFANVLTGQRFTATGGNEMGSEVPTWTGDDGDFVQNINPAVVDGSNMYLMGWIYDSAAWFPQYVSTVTPAT